MLGRKFLDSILVRLFLVGFVLVVIALVGRYFVLAKFLREDITGVVAQQQLSLATYAAKDIDHSITQRQDFLQRLAATMPPSAPRNPAELARWVTSVQATQTLFSAGLLVTDGQGRVLTHSHIAPLDDARPLLSPAAMKSMASGKAYVGHPIPTTDTSKSAVPVMVQVTDTNGQAATVLMGLTFLSDQDFLGNLLHSSIGQSGGGFLLVSPQDQMIIASSQPDMILMSTPPPGVNLMNDRAMAGYRGVGVAVNSRGIEEISAVASVPSTGWFVVARIPTSEALVTVTRAKTFLFRNAFFSMTVFLTVFITVLYLLLRPLIRATAQAEKMSLGLAPMKPLQAGGHCEVGTLITAFNRLMDKLNEQNLALATAAHHDALTGLSNRVLLSDRLRQALAQAKRHQTKVALLFLDLDMFKPINDTLGHEAGDKVLQEVARRLMAVVRATDSVARIGGDEFVVLLGEIAPPARPACERVAQEIIAALNQPIEVAGTQRQIGVSIGGVIADDRSTPDRLLTKADNLMYQAKAQGRGRFVIEEEHESPANAGTKA